MNGKKREQEWLVTGNGNDIGTGTKFSIFFLHF